MQNVETAGSQNNNNVAAAAAARKPRRSPQEAREARLKREADLLAKQNARTERLKKEAAEAEARAKEIEARKNQIESNVPVVKEKKEVPVIGETRAQRIQREVKAALKEIGAKHGVTFDDLTPRLTMQGQALSLRVVAHVAAEKATSKKVAVGASREAQRFIENAKVVGIKPSLLGKEVQLAGEDGIFKLMGLKGRAHDVVLQKIIDGKPAEGTDGIKTVTAAEFKTKMVLA
jgi:Tfp pilus assembly protein PilN